MKTRKAMVSMTIGLGLSFTLLPPAIAIGIGGGITSGSDDSFSINLSLFNDVNSTADVLDLTINGSTANAFPLVWESVLDVSPPSGASVSTFGEGTQLLSFSFTPAADGFNPGESFGFSVDPDTIDDPNAGIIISQLIGVRARFNFADSSSFLGVFVDDPAPNAGLVLQPVPEPLSVLGTIALGTLGTSWILKRRQQQKA